MENIEELKQMPREDGYGSPITIGDLKQMPNGSD